jgi:hypothetical protein
MIDDPQDQFVLDELRGVGGTGKEASEPLSAGTVEDAVAKWGLVEPIDEILLQRFDQGRIDQIGDNDISPVEELLRPEFDVGVVVRAHARDHG